ncbi:hemoglobin subunit pi-like [Orbicella faveolata]|uniref:hemoglobin subunit pi-like n=1 Tax=Orbicella faveolata TaxID=48498 RepID=UPI0009E1A59D|nr:hemoglobin subunit pi-like [Orbicella faveolata]
MICSLLRLFEKDPGLQNMFAEFREVKLEELARTRELHGHTERVMRAVENCVNAMDDPDSLRAYLMELGRRHVYRSAKPSVGNLHLLSRALISTFQETIPNDWVPEVAAAWEVLLNYFTIMLKEGIRSSVQ